MANKTKILSELSKIAVDAMGAFSGIKSEIETIVKLRVEKVINKMNLVRRDEFEVLNDEIKKIITQCPSTFSSLEQLTQFYMVIVSKIM